ncbi:transmembrane channel-like protein 6 isoform X1 [Alligator sinensis]|uniref:Transmembrane channel-like protein n=2 Tax=Alligator sinensis TaxID=38654 RepID=A0A1U8DL06_ALLSI|nr:transmembrane channel-like protein 6 isoform X1 [Alligator sinensis]XP_014381897.1 transmembrane channel-like protein 6 isoform X1 [Alligator sinensis]
MLEPAAAADEGDPGPVEEPVLWSPASPSAARPVAARTLAMSQPLASTLPIPEGQEDTSPDLSPYDEGAVHDSFHEIIQEQGLQLRELCLGGKEPLAYMPPLAPGAEAWAKPECSWEHPEYSAATLRILASMPSRTIGSSRGAILSQYYNRTARLRRRSSRPPLLQTSRAARPSLRQYDLELDAGHAQEEEKRCLLVKELQSLPSSQRSHLLLTMPLSLAQKRSLRQDSSGQGDTLKKPRRIRGPLPGCSQVEYHLILGVRSTWYGLLSSLPTLQPWHYALKQIGGRFGSSVLSYFLFLKTLLLFNLLLFLLLLVFVVAMQAAYPPTTPARRTFMGLELLTGAGSFTHTLMYCGYYSNDTLNDPCILGPSSVRCQRGHSRLPYNMPLAYLFTIGVSFFITCILLVYSMSRSFGESYRVDSTRGDLAMKLFCTWDWKVTQRRSVQLLQDNLCTQLKELLGELRDQYRPRSLCQQLHRLAVLALTWALSLGSVLACVLAVYYFSEHMHRVQQKSWEQHSSEMQEEAQLLALPLVVSLMNLVLPYVYSGLGTWERQESPVLGVYVAICRNLLLKMVVLGMLCYHWLSRKVGLSGDKCWETSVGQELYRFVVMDFIFVLLDTLLGELLWRLILEKRLKRKQRPEFDIARNVLELIYGQTLTWLGVLFSPLLPAIQILKLLLLFYIKKASLMKNCQSPSKPWRASHMSTVFITLLCFPSFLGAAVFLSYTIWSAKPSETCSPFRTLETIYESGKTWVRRLEHSGPSITWFTWIHQHLVENTFFLFFMSSILLAVIYLKIQVVKGQRRIIGLLKEQITNEGADKTFLIQKLHSIYAKQEQRT